MSQQSAVPATGVVMTLVSAPQFKTQVTHGPSGAKLPTEAPKDNGGTGGSFSPTDLMATALASCVVTTMQLAATREGFTLGEVSASVEKRMSPPPRRIAELVLSILLPSGLAPPQRAMLEKIVHECPVARSLHPDVKVTASFGYPD
ncbi:OsmC family protein [Corallococcus sp. ZKHCc1 1396]|uniref:OsmC family protein n=1 Tax=Corallococcus soli TaxID=2710757 RepID=A0ABR9PXK4_9BACT|nr:MULTISPECIES: OsmC family protein [Corallococcus]MBE4752665.1 OsmC family protein [Corallococcus soli]MCY1034505.1 OsmC family protein [Corallococcus sp. BB11-1]RYZ34570.1 MAG: OsmC family peroxiredoxin [Myxococcaceae bacterium]